MPHGIQIAIVMSLQGRCHFVESLKGITLNIFIENERTCLYICIIVEQQYVCLLAHLSLLGSLVSLIV